MAPATQESRNHDSYRGLEASSLGTVFSDSKQSLPLFNRGREKEPFFSSIKDIIRYPYQDSSTIKSKKPTLLQSKNKLSMSNREKRNFRNNGEYSWSDTNMDNSYSFRKHVNKRSRAKKLPKIGSCDKDTLDIKINNLVKVQGVVTDYSLHDSKYSFQKSNSLMQEKFEERLEDLRDLVPENKQIKLSTNQKSFILECGKWLQKAIENPGCFNDEAFIKQFKITESGDIYKGEHNGDAAQGHGICFNRQGDLIEGIYKGGILSRGMAKVLYNNGEFYAGQILNGGDRNGQGIYYYSNGDVYDGQFVKNKRVGKSRLIFSDKSEYIGQFIDDEADGHGIFTDKGGNRYMSVQIDSQSKEDKDIKTGFFLRGRLYGKGEIHFKNTDHYIGNFKGTKRHGFGIMNFNAPRTDTDYSNLGVYEGNWKNG